MGIVRTAEWKLTVPPETARDRLRQALTALDMEPAPDGGDMIRASSKRSLRRNRWASEISIEVSPQDDGSLAVCSVDMVGNKHYGVMSEILEAVGDDVLDDRGAAVAIERLGKAGRLFGRKEVRHLEHILHARERVVSVAGGVYEGKNALIVLTDERLFMFEKSLGSETQAEFGLQAISSLDVKKRMTGETITLYASGNSQEIKHVMHGQGAELVRQFRNLMHERQAQAASPAPAPTLAEADPLDKLKKLGELRDAGVLSEEEFEQQKAGLLKQM